MQKKTKENLIDLSSEENGGSVLLASDEFFAPKENLLKKGNDKDFVLIQFEQRRQP